MVTGFICFDASTIVQLKTVKINWNPNAKGNDPCFDWEKKPSFWRCSPSKHGGGPTDPKLFSSTWGLLSYAHQMGATAHSHFQGINTWPLWHHDPSTVLVDLKNSSEIPETAGKIFQNHSASPVWLSPLNPSGLSQPPVLRFHICDATQSWGNSAYFSQVEHEAFKFPNIREDIVCFQQKMSKGCITHTTHSTQSHKCQYGWLLNWNDIEITFYSPPTTL